MPVFLERKDIDEEKWNAVAGDFLFARTEYLDAMCATWCGLMLGNYDVILPIAEGQKWWLKYAYQPFFTQSFRLQQAEGFNENPDAVAGAFLQLMRKRYFRIDLCLQHQIHPRGFREDKLPNQILHLNKPYHDLRMDYSASTKRKINQAVKQDLKAEYVSPDTKIEHLIRSFYGSRELTNTESTERHLNTIKQLYEMGKAKILIVYDGSNFVNATILRYTDKNRWSMSSINTSKGRDVNATFFAIDQIIEKHAEQPLILDFEGSKIEGVVQRNKGFGAIDEPYFYYRYRKL